MEGPCVGGGARSKGRMNTYRPDARDAKKRQGRRKDRQNVLAAGRPCILCETFASPAPGPDFLETACPRPLFRPPPASPAMPNVPL
ncbi:hypothetical protein APY03_7859 [Variovorax sp. WDL1]|nr:hypothetical protein APY03_7859 [Variovorax sp. WDL1]